LTEETRRVTRPASIVLPSSTANAGNGWHYRSAGSSPNQTLENAPVEATELLGEIAAVPEIRSLVQEADMGQTQIEEGKSLLMKAIWVPSGPAGTTDTPEAMAARAASAELIKRREYLIRMGLAERKSRNKEAQAPAAP
jgi:hypothetical protein